jgi:hypothetical protein
LTCHGAKASVFPASFLHVAHYHLDLHRQRWALPDRTPQ